MCQLKVAAWSCRKVATGRGSRPVNAQTTAGGLYANLFTLQAKAYQAT
jgi:hypothetical protein